MATLAVMLVAACGPDVEPPIGHGYSADPVELIGLWRVEADGEPDETWLRMEAGSFQLWRGAGFDDGNWDASETHLVATTWGHVGEDHGVLGAEWLDGTHAVRRTEDGWQLLTDDGEPIATMTVDGAPEPIGSASDDYAQPPELTDDAREALRPPEPLPEDLEPATTADLTGRWVPADTSYATDPHVILHDDGSWGGSDGCNGVGGGWAVPEDGRLLSTAGPMTAIGCEGAPVGWWLAGASLAGLDGDVLVLLDRDGTELGRLTEA